jgi:AraC-like DNA-binding protein
MFRKYLSQTPNEYLTEYRLNKSAEYLRNTDMTATEIAFTVGLCGGSYFSEIFRKWSGVTPMEYKNNLIK